MNKHRFDECCYPFMNERGYLCDFEMLTDELCSQLGMALALWDTFEAPEQEFYQDIEHLQQRIYHLNGSVRGRCGIFAEDMDWLHQRYAYYQDITHDCVRGFVLPRGAQLACVFHQARCQGKKVVRILNRLLHEGVNFDPILLRFANLIANFMFVASLYVNWRMAIPETPYHSINYGTSIKSEVRINS